GHRAATPGAPGLGLAAVCLAFASLAARGGGARPHGHQVADRGTPAKAVLDAYDAAHPTTSLAEAS
ncbi:hypothetical protein ACH4C6_32450, partial [Streptomyces sp. NPDC017943]